MSTVRTRPGRVCMVVHARFPIGEPRVHRQAVAAIDAGYEVDVVCLRHRGEPREEVVDGARVRRLPVSHDRSAGAAGMAGEYLLFALLATLTVARLHAVRRYDVVHVSNPPDLLVAAGALPRLLGARVILDVHDLTPDLFEWRFGRSRAATLVSRLLVAQERLSCRLADRVMTVHRSCADVLAARSALGRDVTIVMNAPDERLLAPVRRRSQTGWHEPVRLVYHGSLTELYGVHVLLEAVAKRDLASRVRVTIIGDGDQRRTLVRRVAELGLDGAVTFSDGYRPIAEALAAVARCDIGVVPLLGLPVNRFSLPSKLFEYVALGLPVVSARTETIARHFSENEVTFFRPGDADDLAARLVHLLDDPASGCEQAERAAARRQAYRWETSRERFVQLLSEAARGG